MMSNRVRVTEVAGFVGRMRVIRGLDTHGLHTRESCVKAAAAVRAKPGTETQAAG